MDQTTLYCSIKNHISIQLTNLKIFLNSFSYNFSRSSSTYSLTSLHLICSSYYRIHGASLYIPKPLKSSFHHLFYYRCYLTLFLILSFQIVSRLFLPHNQRNIPISDILRITKNANKLVILKHITVHMKPEKSLI